MSREVTPRDWAILGVFTVALVLGCYAYYRHVTAPSASRGQTIATTTATQSLRRTSEALTTTDTAQAPVVQQSASPTALPRRDYRFIADRNIFQPPRESPPQRTQPSTTVRSTAPPTPSRTPRGLSAPPPLPPAPPPLPAASTPPPSTVMASRPANLTATGVVRLGSDTYVVLENPQTRDTAFVRVGESAFGYQVVNAGDNYVEVRQGDFAYRITLGEGKQERKILAMGGAPGQAPRPGAVSSPPSPPGSPSGFGMGNRGGDGGNRRRNPSEWVTRVVDRWNQLPEFVRNRIMERLRENWSQMSPEQQQQVQQALQRAGVNFTP